MDEVAEIKEPSPRAAFKLMGGKKVRGVFVRALLLGGSRAKRS